MASLGYNFDFRIPPRAEARGGRFMTPYTALAGTQSAGGGTFAFSAPPLTFPGGLLPIGCPVVFDSAGGPGSEGQDSYGRQYVKLPSAGATISTEPLAGILVYNYGPAWTTGYDPYPVSYSDLGFAPLNAPCIVVAGDPACKILLRNTVANSFLGIQNYPGRIMVNGLGATSTVAVGDYLIPGNGNDTDGYWESTGTEAGAWAVITRVDTTRLEVEARLLF